MRVFWDPITGIPEGLCGNRAEHRPHHVLGASVAPRGFWCHAEQHRRITSTTWPRSSDGGRRPAE